MVYFGRPDPIFGHIPILGSKGISTKNAPWVIFRGPGSRDPSGDLIGSCQKVLKMCPFWTPHFGGLKLVHLGPFWGPELAHIWTPGGVPL